MNSNFTTREQREQIVRESLGDDYDVGCGYESTGINYQLYIVGIKELRELNMEANCGFEVAHPEHVAVADSKVRPFTESRACLDFKI